MALWDPGTDWRLVATYRRYANQTWEVWYNVADKTMWYGKSDNDFFFSDPREVASFESQDWAWWFVDTVRLACDNARRLQRGEHVEGVVAPSRPRPTPKEKPWYLKTGEADLKYERSE